METLIQKFEYFLSFILLNNQIRFDKSEKLIAAKSRANTIVETRNLHSFFNFAPSYFSYTQRFFKPLSKIYVGICDTYSHLKTIMYPFCFWLFSKINVSFTIQKSSKVACLLRGKIRFNKNFCLNCLSRQAIKLTFVRAIFGRIFAILRNSIFFATENASLFNSYSTLLFYNTRANLFRYIINNALLRAEAPFVSLSSRWNNLKRVATKFTVICHLLTKFDFIESTICFVRTRLRTILLSVISWIKSLVTFWAYFLHLPHYRIVISKTQVHFGEIL